MPRQHPEADPKLNDLLKEIGNAEVVPVKCLNCGADTVINAAYAKYVRSPISSCRLCR